MNFNALWFPDKGCKSAKSINSNQMRINTEDMVLVLVHTSFRGFFISFSLVRVSSKLCL